MKYNDIYNFNDLKDYCKICDTKYDKINITPPFLTPHTPNYLGDLYHSPSGALGFRLFTSPITYYGAVVIKGIIYSYYTPIGTITNSGLQILQSRELPFKSATTKKLVTILNRNTLGLSLNPFIFLLRNLDIKLGWLE